MEIKKGDKLILEPVEVFNITSEDEIYIKLKGGEDPIGVTKQEVKCARKVLGLLGDEGLEPQVGMKLWDSTFGDGEIIEVDEDIAEDIAYPVEVRRFDNGRIVLMTLDGSLSEEWNRTCYVTAMPEEERGWAVYKTSGRVVVSLRVMTRMEAEYRYGLKLINWIPESEVKK